MKKEINRYTLNLVADGSYVPFAISTIENIDSLMTNFKDKFEVINFIETYCGLDFLIEDIVVTYNVDKHIKEAPLIFNESRAIVDDKKLVDRIIIYLGQFSNVQKLAASNLNNHFLTEIINKLLKQTTMSNYNFVLNKTKMQLLDEYKLKRDLSLYLEDKAIKRGSHFLNQSTGNSKNIDEIKQCLEKMEIVYQVVMPITNNNLIEGVCVNTGDPYLDSLIATNDYDTIAKLYDLDMLQSLGVSQILDGIHNISDEKGRSK